MVLYFLPASSAAAPSQLSGRAQRPPMRAPSTSRSDRPADPSLRARAGPPARPSTTAPPARGGWIYVVTMQIAAERGRATRCAEEEAWAAEQHVQAQKKEEKAAAAEPPLPEDDEKLSVLHGAGKPPVTPPLPAAGPLRARSTMVKEALACWTPRSRTIPSTPSTGRDTVPVEITIEEDQIVIRRAVERRLRRRLTPSPSAFAGRVAM